MPTSENKHPFDEILMAEYLITPVKRLATNINKSHSYVVGRLKKLGLIIPPEIIAKRKEDSRIKPGTTPKNKGLKQSEYMSAEMIERTKETRFKKGMLPHNAVGFKDGDISVRHSHKQRNSPPYKWIRIKLGHWKMYHVHIWEQENGPTPKGSVIVFKDKNTMNTIIENLECITLEENMLRNSIQRYPEEIKKTIQVISLITRKINKHEKQNQ
jgi:hypothetical protein